MTRPTIYLDSNATTEPLQEVRDGINSCLADGWANPSSIHRPGFSARSSIELARGSVARLVDADPGRIVFTSGGTESANLAINGVLSDPINACSIISSPLEHGAVSVPVHDAGRRGAKVSMVSHDRDGQIDLSDLEDRLSKVSSGSRLVSIMWVNNETGVIQPIGQVARLCRSFGWILHCDATQAVGKLPLGDEVEQVDLLTFSAHKFHGPKGIGALRIRDRSVLGPVVTGGPQESGLRGGTENTPGIVGMGIAAERAAAWLDDDGHVKVESLRAQFEQRMGDLGGVTIHGEGAPRLWTTSCIGFDQVESESLLMMLSEQGVCASGGAACASGALEPSHVLVGMGVPHDLAMGSIRFSFSRLTTPEQIDAACEIIEASVRRLRSMDSSTD